MSTLVLCVIGMVCQSCYEEAMEIGSEASTYATSDHTSSTYSSDEFSEPPQKKLKLNLVSIRQTALTFLEYLKEIKSYFHV